MISSCEDLSVSRHTGNIGFEAMQRPSSYIRGQAWNNELKISETIDSRRGRFPCSIIRTGSMARLSDLNASKPRITDAIALAKKTTSKSTLLVGNSDLISLYVRIPSSYHGPALQHDLLHPYYAATQSMYCDEKAALNL